MYSPFWRHANRRPLLAIKRALPVIKSKALEERMVSEETLAAALKKIIQYSEIMQQYYEKNPCNEKLAENARIAKKMANLENVSQDELNKILLLFTTLQSGVLHKNFSLYPKIFAAFHTTHSHKHQLHPYLDQLKNIIQEEENEIKEKDAQSGTDNKFTQMYCATEKMRKYQEISNSEFHLILNFSIYLPLDGQKVMSNYPHIVRYNQIMNEQMSENTDPNNTQMKSPRPGTA